jgi:hypothetical protein
MRSAAASFCCHLPRRGQIPTVVTDFDHRGAPRSGDAALTIYEFATNLAVQHGGMRSDSTRISATRSTETQQ